MTQKPNTRYFTVDNNSNAAANLDSLIVAFQGNAEIVNETPSHLNPRTTTRYEVIVAPNHLQSFEETAREMSLYPQTCG